MSNHMPHQWCMTHATNQVWSATAAVGTCEMVFETSAWASITPTTTLRSGRFDWCKRMSWRRVATARLSPIPNMFALQRQVNFNCNTSPSSRWPYGFVDFIDRYSSVILSYLVFLLSSFSLAPATKNEKHTYKTHTHIPTRTRKHARSTIPRQHRTHSSKK